MATVVKINPKPYAGIIAKAQATLNGLSPAANRAAAAVQAQAPITQQVGASNATFNKSQQALLDMQTRAQEFAKARASEEAATSNLLYGQLGDAAKEYGALGTGLTGAVGDAWNAASADAASKVADMTGGRIGSVSTAYANPDLQNAATILGVTLPGQGLVDEARAAAARARGEVSAGANQVGSIAANYGQQMTDAITSHAQDLAAIRAQRPQLFQTALDALTARHDKAQDTLNSLIGAETGYESAQQSRADKLHQAAIDNAYRRKQAANQLTIQQEALTHRDPVTGEPVGDWMVDPTDPAGKRLMTTTTYYNKMANDRDFREKVRQFNVASRETKAYHNQLAQARQQAAARGGTYSESLSKQMHVLVDSRGNPILVTGPDGKPSMVRYRPQAAKPPKPPNQATSIRGAAKLAQSIAKQYYAGDPIGLSGTQKVVMPTNPNNPADRANYDRAYRSVYAYLQALGIGRKKLQSLTTDALTSAGFVAPTAASGPTAPGHAPPTPRTRNAPTTATTKTTGGSTADFG